MSDNAIKALEGLELVPTSNADDLLKIFLEVLRTSEMENAWNAKTLVMWAKRYCTLESITLPPEYNSPHAAGKYCAQQALQGDGLLDAAGKYGNKHLYEKRREDTHDQIT